MSGLDSSLAHVNTFEYARGISKVLEAIVLAGGFGTRLSKIVKTVPKPMAPVAGRPFLEILLSMLASKRVGRIVLSLGYMAEHIIRHFGDRFRGMELVYEIERKPLGTGGATRLALSACKSDHVFIFNGDTFLDLEIDEVEAQWQAQHVPIIIGCEVADTVRYGRLDTVNGQVRAFQEKGIAGPGLINAGCYVLPLTALDEFAPGQQFSLETDFLVKAVSSERFDLFVTKGKFIDIGVPEDYYRAQIELAGTDF